MKKMNNKNSKDVSVGRHVLAVRSAGFCEIIAARVDDFPVNIEN